MRDHIIFAIVLFAALALLMACGEGGGADTEGPSLALTAEACETSECHDRVSATIQALRPTPIPVDPRMREILLENSAVEELVAGGLEREDYWLIIDMFSSPANGDDGGMAVIVFAEPVSFSGEAPTASQPCKGHGDEGRIDPDDACLLEPREYGTRQLSFADIRVVHTQVDTGRGSVVRLFPGDPSSEIVEDMIEWAEETQYD